MKIVLLSQARLGSSRLPNKVIKQIDSKSILQIHLERIKKSKLIDDIILVTTFEKEIDKVLKIAASLNVKVFQGSTFDVLDRFYQSIANKDFDYVVRVTSDCPLIDPKLIDKVIELTLKNNLDYCSNILIESFPDGQDVEVFTKESLKKAWKNAKLKSHREHVSLYIRENSSFMGGKMFKSDNLHSIINYEKVRMTVDEKKDFEAIECLVQNLGINESWESYTDFILNNRTLFPNQNITRNQGLNKSIIDEKKH